MGFLCAGVLVLASCRSLPDTEYLTRQYRAQAAQFTRDLGKTEAKRRAAIVARLERKAGPLDLLGRQVALEEQIAGTPLATGNEVELLQDGPATFAAMFKAIGDARHNINAEFYSIGDDDVGRRFANAILAKCRAGVEVNLIYDSVGAMPTPGSFFDRLRQGGVRVVEFNTVKPFKVRNPLTIIHRDHRKLLVIDGRTAFLGGINMTEVYSRVSSFPSTRSKKAGPAIGWRDTDVRIDGPAVAEFQRTFVQNWAKQGGPPLARADYFPKLKNQGHEVVRAVASTPDDPYSRIYLTLIAAIGSADKQVCLANAYFVPDPQLMEALTEAAARGVDVRLIVPGNSDVKPAYYAGRSHYSILLKAGVRIYERRGPVLHAKTAVIDGIWSCVGSSNLDWRSALGNDEINAVILGQDFGEKMMAAYRQDMAASDAIVLDRWKRRPLVPRLKEWTAGLFGRLF